MEFRIGQRWVSQTDAALGLGLVTEVAGRRVRVSFPAVDEERTYATDSAPLARVRYQVGERIHDMHQRPLTITALDSQDGLILYHTVDDHGEEVALPEVRLSPYAHFTRPEQRLFCGQSDRLEHFTLRLETLEHRAQQLQSPAQGLIGSRTSHLPHQVYIASEVATRHAPRVLLADEVGLGKTIEAGMILHHRLHTGQARRVLVLVPEPLIHQWLVEMLRRFNLPFSVFNQERYEALQSDFGMDPPDDVVEGEGQGDDGEELTGEEARRAEEDGLAALMAALAEDRHNAQSRSGRPGATGEDRMADQDEGGPLAEGASSNPFDSEQRILCSLEWLTSNPEALEQALATDWDMLVVDEAHHLRWSPEAPSPEYQAVERLAHHIPGVLLLTATPEQAGQESHFARLRLLDPARFTSLEAFQQEARNYSRLNTLVQELLEQSGPVSESQWQALTPWLGEDHSDWPRDPESVVRLLLDCHGTSRVLFRNTRAAVRGFPERQVHSTVLEAPQQYRAAVALEGEEGLFPETQWPDDSWLQLDPRVAWLEQLLRELRPAKVLVICAHGETAKALEHHLQLRAGIRSAAFYEGLDLIERDRAAAYFAATEQGAQALICSEIGSEGRNFQFAQHLVLFDLPLNPDLLEQRIGRLDRIGQSGTIHLHVPTLAKGAQSVLLRWYNEGLDALSRSCAVGNAVKEQLEAPLMGHLQNPEQDQQPLIERTRKVREQLEEQLEEGRDALIERNSNNPRRAAELIRHIEAAETPETLSDYMLRLFDQYGVEYDPLPDNGLVIRPSDHLAVADFPHLPDEGLSLTFDRQNALVREDLAFLSWEHPLVEDTMDMLIDSEQGNATVGTMAIKGVQAGTLLLEGIYRAQCPAPRALGIGRHLSPAPLRFLTSMDGRDLSHVLSHEKLNSLIEKIKRRTAQTIVPQLRDQIEAMLPASQALAERALPQLQEQARESYRQALQEEIERLKTLKRRNPAIRDEEIGHFEQQLEQGLEAIDRTSVELDALRVVITT
ncbi:MAG: RNA polymerase-associated protein RapA [Oleiphilaceae bacterium]|nr:RNA polymerase-associated protein RapA [Oleiphilaceae bacterium]